MKLELTDTQVHIHTDEGRFILKAVRAIAVAVARLEAGQQILIAQGAEQKMANEDLKALVDEINAKVADLATAQQAQGALLTEVGADLDALIAGTTDPELRTKLEAVRDSLTTATESAAATTEALTQLAAKHDPAAPARTDSDGGGNGELPDGRK